ncbi:MAG: hypothetical protein WC588_02220 [Candidatus Micrarchaeia archaeon]
MRLPFNTVNCRQKEDRKAAYHSGTPAQGISAHRRKKHPHLTYFWRHGEGQDAVHLLPIGFLAYKPLPQSLFQVEERYGAQKATSRSLATAFALGLAGSFYETLLCLMHPRKFISDVKTVAGTFLSRKSFRAPAEIFLANGFISDVFGWVGSAVFGAIGASYNVGLAVAGVLLGDAFFSAIGAHVAWFSTCYRTWAKSHAAENPGRGRKLSAALDLEKHILHSMSRNTPLAIAFIGGAAIAMAGIGIAFGAGVAVAISRLLDIPSTIAYRAATVAPNSKFISLVEEKMRLCKQDGSKPTSQE